jgi:elongation factor G
MTPQLDPFFHRATVTRYAMAERRIVRRIGGQDEYAHVRVSVVPLAKGSGNLVQWHAGSNIPSRFVGFVMKGLGTALEKGVLGGIAFVDVCATVENGSYHESDSSEPSFREAAEHATTDALQRAQPHVLEATLALTTSVPEEFTGVVTGMLEAHDEVIQQMNVEERIVLITANLVWSHAQTFMSEVLHNTQATARFSLRILDFVELKSRPQPPDEWASLT